MKHRVLGIGYHENEREAVCAEWLSHGIVFHFADSIGEAVWRLRQEDYVCITIFSTLIDNGYLEMLRNAGPVPVVVLSPECSISQRAEYFQLGAKEFIINVHQQQVAKMNDKDAVQFYLDSSDKGEKPLTIVTTTDLYFCLEYRSVEVRGQNIELTAKEFDILALLITHPKRVYTFELTLQKVWGEEYSDASRQMLWNHVSRLRQKMKVEPDVPEYIRNVRGVGYKYDPEA